MQNTKYMQMALKLAARGIGQVEPNPAVGCVIVKDEKIIGTGWHKKFGQPHAEINALENCKTLAVNPKGSTMYITLEPCCHQGKTPPCTDAIIAAGITKVVIATTDPSTQVNGKGIEQLQRAAVEVEIGICENQAKLLNAPFIKFAKTGKCWVILKWAQSIDGKLAYPDGNNQRWISTEKSRKDAHKLRRRAQAILVGINTVLADDPLLTARPCKGKKLTRIVLDRCLRVPLDCKLLDTADKADTLIFTSDKAAQTKPQITEQIIRKGAELLTCPDTTNNSNLHFLLDELSKRSITQLLVEGGATLIASFLKENLADEICVYIAPKILGAQAKADITYPMTELTETLDLHCANIRHLGSDVCINGLTKKAINEISIKRARA